MGAELLSASEEKGGVHGLLLTLWGMDTETLVSLRGTCYGGVYGLLLPL